MQDKKLLPPREENLPEKGRPPLNTQGGKELVLAEAKRGSNTFKSKVWKKIAFFKGQRKGILL